MPEKDNRMTSKYKIIEQACNAIDNGSIIDAKGIIEANYPFKPLLKNRQPYGKRQMLRIFLRDGFVDRYSGEKMVFPAVLRLISLIMPDELPFHCNWKMSECHLAYWQLLPTVDHVVPVSRGGKNDESNWVSTSQLRNSAKSNWLLEELGWTLHEPGNLEDWDGLTKWFCAYISKRPGPLSNNYILSWYRALLKEY